MATNDFIGFASSGSANIISQADYAAAAEQTDGVQPGLASSKLANKVWRQGANMAAAIGGAIKDQGYDALDNGDLNALKTAIESAFLMTGGGTMSSAIAFNATIALRQVTTDSALIISGGNTNNSATGAKLTLNGGTNSTNPGRFTLQAGNSNGYKQLVGAPDGTLIWGGSDIFTVGNSPLSSNVSAQPYTYKVKFANGAMIQALYGEFTTDSNSRVEWTYPEAFLEFPFVTVLKVNAVRDYNFYSGSKTMVRIRCNNMSGAVVGSGDTANLMIIAIGRWK